MKPIKFLNIFLLFTISFSFGAAARVYATSYSTTASKEILDQPYGNDPQQRMDIYLPKDRNINSTKVFIIVHGGGWYRGDKSDLNSMVSFLKTNFPKYAIVNVNYRLGTKEKIGFPRQIDDLARAISHLDAKYREYNISKRYAMIGTSAGGHLAMLYSYKYNTANKIKSVCSIVAPTDFSDPAYKGNQAIKYGLQFFIGDYTSYRSNPKIYNQISPVNHITAAAPPTLLIQSNNDPFVPNTQGKILVDKLKSKLVYNEYYKYENAGHGMWSRKQQSDIDKKMKKFFTLHF